MKPEERAEYLKPFTLTSILKEEMMNLREENEGVNIILKQANKSIAKDKFSAFYENRSMHFFNIMLEDIVTDLERLFCTKIIILNESIAKTKYFAFFCNNESLAEILDALNSDKKIKITKKNGVIYLK